jgi:threonine/homoserine/homoserine lactone efflux protein
VVLLAVMLAVDIAWLLAGSALAGAMRNPAAARAINVVFAVALLASLALSFL